jgi:hypothetical protein
VWLKWLTESVSGISVRGRCPVDRAPSVYGANPVSAPPRLRSPLGWGRGFRACARRRLKEKPIPGVYSDLIHPFAPKGVRLRSVSDRFIPGSGRRRPHASATFRGITCNALLQHIYWPIITFAVVGRICAIRVLAANESIRVQVRSALSCGGTFRAEGTLVSRSRRSRPSRCGFPEMAVGVRPFALWLRRRRRSPRSALSTRPGSPHSAPRGRDMRMSESVRRRRGRKTTRGRVSAWNLSGDSPGGVGKDAVVGRIVVLDPDQRAGRVNTEAATRGVLQPR